MTDVDDYDDSWKYEDLYREQDEPDYDCWTCQDIRTIRGRHTDGRRVNCPDCRPTPRQRRRRDRVYAWRERRWHRRMERAVAAGIITDFNAEAPF